MERASTSGKMAGSTKAPGSSISYMDTEFTRGQMVDCMRENTIKIKSMALALILGLMAKNTREHGRMENSMVKEFSRAKEYRDAVSGSTAKDSNGSKQILNLNQKATKDQPLIRPEVKLNKKNEG